MWPSVQVAVRRWNLRFRLLWAISQNATVGNATLTMSIEGGTHHLIYATGRGGIHSPCRKQTNKQTR